MIPNPTVQSYNCGYCPVYFEVLICMGVVIANLPFDSNCF